MNVIKTYLERTMQGMTAYLESEKIAVVLIALLILLWLKEKKIVDNKGNRWLVYTTLMIVLLLFPLTAMVMVGYQTAFYDYAWLWSAVPVLAGIAYMVVILYEEQAAEWTKKRQMVLVTLLFVLLFLCGNQGILQKAEGKDADAQEHAVEIVACMEQYGGNLDYMMWSNGRLMQEVRRQTGEIQLVYGRDMWDEKAGAYDYEEYATDMIQAYDWMELVSVVAQDAENRDTFERVCAYYEELNDADIHISAMLESGVNLIVIPEMASEYFAEVLTESATKYNLSVEELFTQQYAIYLLK